jgi:hypothetical protein
MMNLKILEGTAHLASPSVAVQYLAMKFLVGL